MKFYDVDPRSDEWRHLRLGIPTASQFHRILTPKTRKLSSQSEKYMCELLSEWITGEEIHVTEGESEYRSMYMQRGQDIEDKIWKAYEAFAEVETSRGGFFTTDDGMIGCSPDRLIGTNGDLEAKAPKINTQVRYALSGPDEDYICQLQGRLYIHEREFVEIFPWHERLFIPPVRVYRDEKFIADLKSTLAAFVDTMLNCRVKLEQRYGPFTRPTAEEPYSGGDFITQEDEDMILKDVRERRNAR